MRGVLRPHRPRRGHEVAVHVGERRGAEHDEELRDGGDGEDDRQLQDGRGSQKATITRIASSGGNEMITKAIALATVSNDLAGVSGEHPGRSADDEPDGDRGEADR